MKLNILAAGVAAALSMAAVSAHATNGYFSHGYGMKAKGMAGAATARTDDTFGGANNPASMVWVGNRIDLGADLFSPDQGMTRSGATAVPGSVDSEDDYFLIPEFGYNRMLNQHTSLGVTVYGNGGMNTDYPIGGFACPPGFGGANPANPLCGITDLGVDLSQLIIAPTIAYKINESHSIGASPLLVYQRIAITGLHAFAQLSLDPANLTNKGYDDSTGFGVRIGWLGKVTDKVTLGAAYSSKVGMSRFDKYRGLFAESGDFDIPSNWNLGIAFQATPTVKVALDYQRINYSDTKSISDSSQTLGCVPNPPVGPATGAGCLGGANGIGFGWQDVDVWKLGVEYGYSKNVVLRAGWNHGDNPIRGADVTFNILAPGVVQDHLTLGFTYTTPSGGEWTVAYMHAFENDVTGAPNPVYFPAGGTEKINMNQNSLGIAYSWKM